MWIIHIEKIKRIERIKQFKHLHSQILNYTFIMNKEDELNYPALDKEEPITDLVHATTSIPNDSAQNSENVDEITHSGNSSHLGLSNKLDSLGDMAIKNLKCKSIDNPDGDILKIATPSTSGSGKTPLVIYTSNPSTVATAITFRTYDGNIRAEFRTSATAFRITGVNNGTLSLGDTSANVLIGNDSFGFLTLRASLIGFYGVTPVAKATTAIPTAVHVPGVGSVISADDTFDGYTVGQLIAAVRALGLMT